MDLQPQRLERKTPTTMDVENWDDDHDIQGIDDLNLRNFSTTTNATSASLAGGASRGLQSRDSLSSRQSLRSDQDEDLDWELALPSSDEIATQNAIASAKSKGVPLPANVPPSALLGGTIKRLGGRKVQKVLSHDWDDDLELPSAVPGALQLRTKDYSSDADALRNVSITSPVLGSTIRSPQHGREPSDPFGPDLKSAPGFGPAAAFADGDTDDVPTIKIARTRVAPPIPAFPDLNVNVNAHARPPQRDDTVDPFEDDFELPVGGQLKLSTRKEAPKTPASQNLDEIDTDWADSSQHSLSLAHDARRTGRSNRSSSFSALSPSVFSPSLSSCLTAESEDEGLDGLVLPDGPLQLDDALRKRREAPSPDADFAAPTARPGPGAGEDFFNGIEFGEGEVFDSRKLTLNRNIKQKAAQQTSPTRRPAMTLTFTNPAAAPPVSRIPKPAASADRQRSKLEPVAESGGPPASYKRSQSRLGGHSTQASTSSIPTPVPAVPAVAGALPSAPSTPSRRGLSARPSRETLRQEPTTTNSQLLRAKRSMPMLSSRPPMSPATRPPVGPANARPASRADKPMRSSGLARPKTPIERGGAESSLGHSRRPPPPFLPAGSTTAPSHHFAGKASRPSHRPTSSDSASHEPGPQHRSISRLSTARNRPTTPSTRRDVAPESLVRAAASKKTLTKPTRRVAYGDGHELDAFDDLPTSAASESRFVKHPMGSATIRGTSTTSSVTRGKFYAQQNQSAASLGRIEPPRTPLSPQKFDANVPSWARDTAASRSAREQRMQPAAPILARIAGNANHGPMDPGQPPSVGSWRASGTSRTITGSRPHSKRTPKPPQKPHLIKPLGQGVHEAKSVKGMQYNPQLFRWEGNENALAPFDVPASPRRGTPGPAAKQPALIANFGATKGVQVVGGMVFDPQRMCWLKMGAGPAARGRGDRGVAPSLTTDDDEDDPFAGLDDLEDDTGSRRGGAAPSVTGGAGSGSHHGRRRESGVSGAQGSDDEWTVNEEFDVGPDFVRRQRHEEDRWIKRLRGWQTAMQADAATIARERWAIRDLVRS